MIVDMKMDGKFTHKDRPVAGIHKTASPLSITYYSVVTRDNVRLEFLIAGMSNLDICACNIVNAYLNAPCREKMWTKAGL